MSRLLRLLLSGALAGSGWWLAKLTLLKPSNINHFFEREFYKEVLESPESMTQLGLLDKYNLDYYNAKLDDISLEKQEKHFRRTEQTYNTLLKYNRHELKPDEQVSFDVLKETLKISIEGKPFMFHDYPVNQLFGLQNELITFLVTLHPIRNIKDCRYYISRLSKVEKKFDQLLDGLRYREAQNIIPPKFVIQKVIAEIEGFLTDDIEQNILFISFKNKMSKINAISEADIELFLTDAKIEIDKTVYAAYIQLKNYLTQLFNKANDDDGVWKLPNGDAYYAYLLKQQTTSNYTPEQVHQLGITEVDRIQNEMREIMNQLNYSKSKSVAQIMNELTTNPQFLYPNTPEGKEECLNEYQKIIEDINKAMPSVFDVLPKATVKVERIPEFKEANSPGAYYNPPSLDGTRPGVFYANMRDTNEIPKWGMYTLTYHEAVPGHHFQIAIQQELKQMPTFRKVMHQTAYMEGWALYAEFLAYELGFEADPHINLGRLQAELFRAVRLVVDTGIHYKKWTREYAINYMNDNTGLPKNDIIAEVERYIVMPAQACSYKIGMIKVLELRQKAKDALQDKFDIKKWHNCILQCGAVPLFVLENIVEEYIANELKLN